MSEQKTEQERNERGTGIPWQLLVMGAYVQNTIGTDELDALPADDRAGHLRRMLCAELDGSSPEELRRLNDELVQSIQTDGARGLVWDKDKVKRWAIGNTIHSVDFGQLVGYIYTGENV